MKIFWKAFFASLLAMVVASFLFIFILIGFISALTSFKDKAITIKENSLLLLKLDNKIVERKSNNPLEDLDLPAIKTSSTIGLNQVLNCIDKAKTDNRIKGIYLELSDIHAGFATVEEIRNALVDFKTSGKFVYAYSDDISQKAYYLATIADSLIMNPMGTFDFKGLSAENTFFKKALDKFGIEMQVVRGKNNKFKSAVEPFLYDKMSDANRQQTSIYLNSIWNYILKGISKDRKIAVDSLKAYADDVMTFQLPEKALKCGFFDNLKYKDQVLGDFRKLTGLGIKDEIPVVTVNEYFKVNIPNAALALTREHIAVVYAEGEIDSDGSSWAYQIDSKEVSKGLREARMDSSVKAIVLRVNSPGGSAFGSEVIWREVKLAQQVKPVIVSMGDYAASGGYYIACGAEAILAQPTTITGSIGVFGVIPNLSGLLTDKIGVTFDKVSTNDHSDMPSFTRKMTPFEMNLMQNHVESIYKIFVSHVAEGRKKTATTVDSIGQGRVWSGINGHEIGLVDKLGGLNDAIKLAASKAGLEHYRIKELPKLKDTFEELMKNFSTTVQSSILKSNLGDSYNLYENFTRESQMRGIYARLPFNLEIN
jgi:protease IV